MHTSNKAAPALACLEPLAGKWHTEGQRLAGPLGPAAPFVAVETFEWLEGGHFLVHRLEGKLAIQPAACVEIFGMDSVGKLFAESYYNDGNRNIWRVAAERQTFVLTGTWSQGADAYELRCTATLVEMGNTLDSKWEQSSSRQGWSTFMETRATKAQPLPNASVGT